MTCVFLAWDMVMPLRWDKPDKKLYLGVKKVGAGLCAETKILSFFLNLLNARCICDIYVEIWDRQWIHKFSAQKGLFAIEFYFASLVRL